MAICPTNCRRRMSTLAGTLKRLAPSALFERTFGRSRFQLISERYDVKHEVVYNLHCAEGRGE